MNFDNKQTSDTDLSRQTLARMQQDPVYRQNVYTLLAQKPEGVRALLTRMQASEDTEDIRRILTALRRQGILALRFQELRSFLREMLQDEARADLHEEIVRTIGAGGVPIAHSQGMPEALIAATDRQRTQPGTRVEAVAALACIREHPQVQWRLAELVVMDPATAVREEAEAALLELVWGAALVTVLHLAGSLYRNLTPEELKTRNPIPVLKLITVFYQAQAKRPQLLQPGAFLRRQEMLIANLLPDGQPELALGGVGFATEFAAASTLSNYPDGTADGFDWWFVAPDKVEGAKYPTLAISRAKRVPDDDQVNHRIIKIENLAWNDTPARSFVGYLLLSSQGNEFMGEMEWQGDLPTKMEWRFTEAPDAELEDDSLALLCDTQKTKTAEYGAFLLERAAQGSAIALAALGEIGRRQATTEILNLLQQQAEAGNPIAASSLARLQG